MGENILINFNCVFLDTSPITLGNNVFIGPNTGIYCSTHPMEASERPKGGLSKPINVILLLNLRLAMMFGLVEKQLFVLVFQ